MIKLGVLDFKVASTAVTAYSGASDFNTDSVDFSEYSKAWIVYLESTHTTGAPQITIEVSFDGSTWFDYLSRAVNVALPVTIQRSSFYPKFMRIAYTANSSNGDITFKYHQINE